MQNRKYLPTVAELIDRLSIIQLKEVFIPEHKDEYAKEIKDIMHDLELDGLDSELIRAVIVTAQMNLHIWHNESEVRKGKNAGENLRLTHGLNGIRNIAKNKIQERFGGRKDYKVDCLGAEFDDWEVSW
jgi:uncharacterized protein (UPF0335 family)|tara:strand:- start:227 stop:613 length:387 start_codon:yes stop_codon:yes gene_type:complete